MDLRGGQQESKLGLNLNMSSSDSSSNGGNSYHSIGASNNNNNNNNSAHYHHNHSQLSNSMGQFHQQQQQQQQFQQQLGNQQVESIEANKGYTFEEQFKQLYELSEDPKRKEFLDDLFQFMADRNQPVNRIPIMAKQVLDLYELYNLVVARGGLVEVINKKIWREITKGLNLPSSITSAAFTLRTQYMKYLYPYECAKNNFSHQDELQQAIDGNRREGRRAGATNLSSFAPYLGAVGGAPEGGRLGHYSASPSPNHLFAGHNLLSQVVQQQQQQQLMQQQNQTAGQQPPQALQLRHQASAEQCEPARPQSGSSNASPSFNQQRLYQGE